MDETTFVSLEKKRSKNTIKKVCGEYLKKCKNQTCKC